MIFTGLFSSLLAFVYYTALDGYVVRMKALQVEVLIYELSRHIVCSKYVLSSGIVCFGTTFY